MRYHKKIYFPDSAENQLQTFTDKLNGLGWAYSKHCLANLQYRALDIQGILTYIKGLELNAGAIFEFYTDDKGGILKACYRVSYNKNIDLILVINKDKRLITIYLNSANDLHYTLKENLYCRP